MIRCLLLLLLLLPACSDGPKDPDPTGSQGDPCPAVAWDPASLDWGELALGVPAERTVTLLNTCAGGPNLAVEASVEGAAFSVAPALASVPPGELATLTVTATVSDLAGATGTLSLVTSDAANPLVALPLAATADPDADDDGHEVPADCDDADPTVFPGATEAWYDGVDQDCSGGSDFDQDADGADSPADCDDTDPAIHPTAAETWYDGFDQDCAGDDDFDQDADGFALALDCDDTAATVYPGAPETWYDGVDQDCAGDDDFDQDADGATVEADCADTDPAVFPGAPETWYDGLDQDCSGGSDFDQDGDGWDQDVDDCADTDPAVHPGAVETWYDGIDGDCDGASDFDQDGDGTLAYSHGGADCLDTDPTTTIGPPEAHNGLDDDCDGLVDEDFVVPGDVVITEVMYDPAAVSDTVGEWFEVHNPGDLAVDLNGWVVYSDDGGLFTVGSSLPIEPGGYVVLGVEDDPALNGGVTVDYRYDRVTFGLADTGDSIFLVAGAATVTELSWSSTWPGATGSAMQLDDEHYARPDAALVGYWCAATAPYGSGDLGTPGAGGTECLLDDDADGAQLSDCNDDDATIHYGAAELVDGVDQNCNGFVDEVELAAADLPYLTGPMEWRYLHTGGIGDFDGDGLLEVAAVEDELDVWHFVPAESWATWGGPVDTYDDADFIATGNARDFDVALLTPDVDLSGDGLADLAFVSTGPTGQTGFSLYHAPFAAGTGPRPPDVRFESFEGSAGPDAYLDAADFDGDGLADLVYGNPASTQGGRSYAGAVAIVDAPSLTGALDYGDAAVALTGDAFERVGSSVAHGDFDGDGHEDLVVGYEWGTCVWLGDGLVTTGTLALSTLATATISEPAAYPIHERAVDDVDEDGTLDLVLEDTDYTQIRWMYDLGSMVGALDSDDHDAVWEPPAYWLPSTPEIYWTRFDLTVPVDVDADGDTEVGVYAENFFSDPLLAWFPPDAFTDGQVRGDEAHVALTLEPTGSEPSTHAADLDGDGSVELLFSDPFAGVDWEYEGVIGVLSF